MGEYQNLLDALKAAIKPNGTQAITGQIMQNALVQIVESIGGNATFAGVATPSTNPGSPDQSVFWLAFTPGTYTNFGNATVAQAAVFTNSGGSWAKTDIDLSKIISGASPAFLGVLIPGSPAPGNIETKGYYLSFQPGQYFNGFWLKKNCMAIWENNTDGRWRARSVHTTNPEKRDGRLIVKRAIPGNAQVGDIYVLWLRDRGPADGRCDISVFRHGDIFGTGIANNSDNLKDGFIAFEVTDGFKAAWDEGLDAAAQYIYDHRWKQGPHTVVPWSRGIRSKNWKITPTGDRSAIFSYCKMPETLRTSLASLTSPKMKYTLWRRVHGGTAQVGRYDRRVSIVRSCGFIPNAYPESYPYDNLASMKEKGMGAKIVRATSFEWRVARHYKKIELVGNQATIRYVPKKLSIVGMRYEFIPHFRKGNFYYSKSLFQAVFPWPAY